jgi:hypothetical protein
VVLKVSFDHVKKNSRKGYDALLIKQALLPFSVKHFFDIKKYGARSFFKMRARTYHSASGGV